MRKFLDTSGLATYQSGKYQGKYDWTNNIGKELYFEYDDISGYIKILDYKKSKPQGYITLQYKDIITTTVTPNLLHLKIPRLFHKEKQTRRYKYDIGDIINKYHDSIKITKQIRINYKNSSCRGYQVECLDCHYMYETREELISTCPICGKKSSYPERFVYSILKQAKIRFVPQKEFEWLHNKFYDVYLPDNDSIIEIHGSIHYHPVKLNGKKSPEETHKEKIISDKVNNPAASSGAWNLKRPKGRGIDPRGIRQISMQACLFSSLLAGIKYEAALNNKVNYYIIKASEPENLFNIAKYVLNFIDFSNISELECEKFANYKSIKDECELWNQGYNLEEIHFQLQKPIQSIQQKLRLGNKYNLCNYNTTLQLFENKITNKALSNV